MDLENSQARLDWESGPEAGRDGDVAAAGLEIRWSPISEPSSKAATGRFC